MGVLRLYDTATREVRELVPRDPGRVAMYVCGPTVYDHPHIGHGRFGLVWDVIRRYLRWSGFDVHFVSNVTDVDDNIIGRALREGRTEPEVAAEYERYWFDAQDRLGIERPDESPHATEFIDRMVELIAALCDRGVAYELEDGVYLDTTKVDGYGLLARQSLDELRSGARVEVAEGKRSPLDFVLWKKAKPGEPSWPSPWGPGRPGWHTECVVMSLDLLGEGFDLHGGGLDLRFPHHENERAQAVALDREFARLWVHSGFVEMGGEKMSKSLGNVRSLTEFVAEHDPRSYRLLVLRAHYRSPVVVTEATAVDAEAALARLDAFARRVEALPPVDPDPAVLDRFRAAMDDDLDTPAAMALVFDSVRAANAALDDGEESTAAALAGAVREMLVAVGLEVGGVGREVPDEVRATARRRDEARAARDFATADALRDELVADGWIVEDTPSGTELRRP